MTWDPSATNASMSRVTVFVAIAPAPDAPRPKPTETETAYASGVAFTTLVDEASTFTRPPFAFTRLLRIPARVVPASVFAAIAAAMETDTAAGAIDRAAEAASASA